MAEAASEPGGLADFVARCAELQATVESLSAQLHEERAKSAAAAAAVEEAQSDDDAMREKLARSDDTLVKYTGAPPLQ